MKISVIAPIYRSSNCLKEFTLELTKSLSSITQDYEIILVDDRCPEDSWSLINELCTKHPNVKGVRLSRNYGQHYAITAGIDHASGDWLIIMDADLQDHPRDIPNMWKKSQEGWDIVYAARKERKDGFCKRLTSYLFHKSFHLLSGVKTNHEIANYTLINRKVANAIIRYRESIRSYPFLLLQVGFKSTTLEVQHNERSAGESSYTIFRLMRLAFHSIIAHSDRILKLMVITGFLLSLISFLLASFFVIKKIFFNISVEGWTSVIVALLCSTSVIVFCVGILGIYIGKIFNEVKARPLYIVDAVIN